MSILIVGASHRTASVELLERLALDYVGAAKLRRSALDSDHVGEALVLTTCNRIEIYAEVDRFHGSVEDLTALLAQQADSSVNGVLFSAVLGEGATSRPLGSGALAARKSISMRPVPDITQAVFCEGVEAAHSAQGDNAAVAGLLGITAPSVRLDSQAKYCSIARGAGDIYLRLPVKKDYQEKIWDHAAGDIIVREAGGQVSDIHGNRLDFSKGRTLAVNKGVVAAPKAIHGQVIDAVKSVLKL